MNYDKEKIAVRLRELRGTRTRREVAEAIGVTENSIIAYEEGQRVPNDALKLKIAEYFGESLDSIFLL